MQPMEECLDLPLRQVLGHLQNRIVGATSYFGVQTLKNPLDFWVYQELLFELQPDVIVEVGNRFGGSTLALAHFCDLLGRGRIIALDIDHHQVPEIVRRHPRISLLEGDACDMFPKVESLISQEESVFIIEDSSHTFENTLRVLETYSPLIKPGGYFIVEDSICHHGLDVGPSPGPYEAIESFVQKQPSFVSDRTKENFLITWNPKGYLRRSEVASVPHTKA
jgi:cephalosporin hydroxylase